jgi:cell division protein FtsW
MKSVRMDKVFFSALIILVTFGIFIFTSASMGLLAREGATFSSVVLNHIFFGLVFGSIAMAITSKISYRTWRKWALPIFAFSLIATLLVFVPHLGFKHGGARRWILIGPFSFQPSEFLKIGYLIYLAGWLSGVKERVSTFRHGTLPFLILTAITGAVMLAQPDTATFGVIFLAGLAMLIIAGGKLRHIAILGVIALIILGGLIIQRPYLKDRVMTFIYPSRDALGTGYQIQQSLIAIGSGGMFGRGFGQSVQKFNFLPEPIGDSIFAVEGEEFGFIGSIILLILITFVAIRGLKIASKSPDAFGGLLTVGIVILITAQSFVNIGAMLGVLPLSGLPLIFVSHGGTALLFALAEMGILLNISKNSR